MAIIKRFEDLEIWQLARDLNKQILPVLEKLNDTKNFDLKSQLDRSAGSVMDNIAEGFERDGNREFIQFLAISKASLGEVRSQLNRVLDRSVIDEKRQNELNEYCLILATKIAKFISYLNNSGYKGSKFKKSEQPVITN